MIVTSCTESQVQARIMFDKRGSSLSILPNYTPNNWWENDVFQITKAGYWVEYEIKRSVSDYRADFNKIESFAGYDAGTGYENSKHKMLESGVDEYNFDPHANHPHFEGKYTRTIRTPNRFYFCLPIELLEKIQVPEYSGLISYQENHGRTTYRIEKTAPLRHKTKHGDKILRPAQITGMNRYTWHFMKQHIEGLT